MRLRLFRAATMAEAIASIRAELGADALILSTRRGAGFVEITAALDQQDPPPPPSPPPPDPWLWHGAPPALLAGLREGTPLERLLRFAALDFAAPLLLAGPPGAGKTLTAVRLATRLVLAGHTPMLISADGERAGAVEQLLAFTRLLGLGVVAAAHPAALQRALARRAPAAPTLIDTAGIDPFDPAQRDHIAGLARVAEAKIALVLPAGLHPEEAGEIAAAFAAAGTDLLIVTRMDHARRLGGVLAAAAAGLALAEAGIGASAAEGLVPLTADFLAPRLAAQPETAA
jgi:flagellar biosynthesis protein FlhF